MGSAYNLVVNPKKITKSGLAGHSFENSTRLFRNPMTIFSKYLTHLSKQWVLSKENLFTQPTKQKPNYQVKKSSALFGLFHKVSNYVWAFSGKTRQWVFYILELEVRILCVPVSTPRFTILNYSETQNGIL